MSEHKLQLSIIQYLELKKFYTIRLNAGAVKTQTGGFMRLSKKGTPDLMAFKPWQHKTTNSVSLYFFEIKLNRPR